MRTTAAQSVTISESEQDTKVIFPVVADRNMQNKHKNNRLFRHTKQAVVLLLMGFYFMIFLLLSTQSSCFRIMHLIKSEQTATNSSKLYVLNDTYFHKNRQAN